MPKFEIIEVLRREVEADSWDEVQQKYTNEEIILGSEEFEGYAINEITENESGQKQVDPRSDWTQSAVGRVEYFLDKDTFNLKEAVEEWQDLVLERLMSSGEEAFAHAMLQSLKKIRSINPA